MKLVVFVEVAYPGPLHSLNTANFCPYLFEDYLWLAGDPVESVRQLGTFTTYDRMEHDMIEVFYFE